MKECPCEDPKCNETDPTILCDQCEKAMFGTQEKPTLSQTLDAVCERCRVNLSTIFGVR